MSGDEQDDRDGLEPEAGSNLVVSEGLGSRELAQRNETAAVAVAARVTAMTQARFALAKRMPRNMDDVRTRILAECDRPGFAEVCRYNKPQGKAFNEDTGEWEEKRVEGWSIRFVEAAVRIMGNCEPETSTLYDDEHKRIIRCSVIDLETNASWAQEITIEKTVERKKLKKNQKPLSKRRNSYGDWVYLVGATDDEVRQKEARLISINLRTLGQRLIPGDLLDDALKRVQTTRLAAVKRDPSAARKELVEKFFALGVKASDLVEYLGGRPLEALTPELLLELRSIGVTMREEGIPWRDILASSPYAEGAKEDGEPGDKGRTTEVRNKIVGKMDQALQKRAAAANAFFSDIAAATGATPAAVEAVLKLAGAGADVTRIARYEKEATGGLDEVMVGEILSRARQKRQEQGGMAPPATGAPVPPSAPPATAAVAPAGAAPTKPPAKAAKPPRVSVSSARAAEIAEQEGVTPEAVCAVVELIGHADDETIAVMLSGKGIPIDAPTVAAIIAAMKK